MRRGRWLRGGRAASLLALLTVVLGGCSAEEWQRNLRFGFPTGVTAQGERIRVLYTWFGVAALCLGALVWGLIFFSIIHFRKRNDELPRQTKYNFLVEVICFTFPFVIICILFWRTVVVEDYVNKLTKNPDVRVQVDAFKWNWQFEYHSYRDSSGRTHDTTYPGARQVGIPSGGNARGQLPLGPHECDEASSNDSFGCGASGNQQRQGSGPLYLNTVGSSSEIPILVIPVNRTVRIVEHSEDVVHSFWVPEFIFKRDVIPYGTTSTVRDNQFEITPNAKGAYVGRCAELCGTYHSQMNFEVRIVPEQKFEAYLTALKRLGPTDPQRQSKALAAAHMVPYAVTTYPFHTSRTARSPSERGQSNLGP